VKEHIEPGWYVVYATKRSEAKELAFYGKCGYDTTHRWRFVGSDLHQDKVYLIEERVKCDLPFPWADED
jgi:hypothetical protein